MPLTKPWQRPGPAMARDLPGNLGVYELGNAEGRVLYVGYAGGHSLFGLRSAIAGHFADDEPNPVIRERATAYRYEVNQMYLTRWKELLMRYQAAHGRLPDGNAAADEPLPRLGKLAPADRPD